MEDEGTTNFNSIKHRSIEYASGSNLVINISNLIFLPIILIIVGIIIVIIGTFLNKVKSSVIKYIGYISLVVGGLLLCLGELGIIIGILVGKKIWDKNRKKRANELVDDDYEYESNNVAEKIIN